MSENVFPSVETTPFGSKSGGGLTKRELFAAMIMQGFASATPDGMIANATGREIVRFAIISADALIAELAKEPKP